jgi:hypothetical protein
MKYLSRAYVYIIFYGDNLSINEFSNSLKLTPSNSGLNGEKGKYGAILKDTFWEYKMKETNALEELECSIKEMREIFEERIELITNYILEKNIQSKCHIVIKSQNNEDTGVLLDENFIAFLHKLKMQIEINIYIDAASSL